MARTARVLLASLLSTMARRSGMTSVAALLRLVPGVQVAQINFAIGTSLLQATQTPRNVSLRLKWIFQ